MEDKSGDLLFENMGNPEILTRFQLNQKEIPSFGITDATYWFFFEYEFINKTEGYLLEIEYPLLDEVTFFYTNNQDELIQKVVGDTFPFAQREFEHRNFLFSQVSVVVATDCSVVPPGGGGGNGNIKPIIEER